MLPLLAALAVNVVVALLWTWPAWSSQAGATSRDDRLAQARRVVEPRLESSLATYGVVLEASEGLAELRQRMLVPSSAGVVRAVQAAATDAGLSMEQARFQPGVMEELGLTELGMTVPVRGSYVALRRLIEALTSTPEFLVIRGVTVSAAGSSDAAPAGGQGLRVDLSLSAFLADGATGAAEPEFLRPPAIDGPRGTAVAGRGETVATSSRSAGEIDPLPRARSLAERLERLPPLEMMSRDALQVELERLQRPVAPASEPRRNLFAYRAPAGPAPAVEAAPEPEPPAVAEPAPTVRLVGILRVDGRWQASLTDGTEIFVGSAGSLLPNGHRIVDIGSEHVEVDTGARRVRLVLEDPGS